jgi:hypothetical protein
MATGTTTTRPRSQANTRLTPSKARGKAKLKTGKSRVFAVPPLGANALWVVKVKASAAILGKAAKAVVGATFLANRVNNASRAQRVRNAIAVLKTQAKASNAATTRMTNSANAASATKAPLRLKPAANAFSLAATKSPTSSERNAAVLAVAAAVASAAVAVAKGASTPCAPA